MVFSKVRIQGDKQRVVEEVMLNSILSKIFLVDLQLLVENLEREDRWLQFRGAHLEDLWMQRYICGHSALIFFRVVACICLDSEHNTAEYLVTTLVLGDLVLGVTLSLCFLVLVKLGASCCIIQKSNPQS